MKSLKKILMFVLALSSVSFAAGTENNKKTVVCKDKKGKVVKCPKEVIQKTQLETQKKERATSSK